MAAATSFIHILVISLLGFSHLIYLNAVPISRTRSLNQLPETQNEDVLFVSEKGRAEESLEEVFINGRMDLESNDYPGTGPNHSHTPKPPLVRGSMN